MGIYCLNSAGGAPVAPFNKWNDAAATIVALAADLTFQADPNPVIVVNAAAHNETTAGAVAVTFQTNQSVLWLAVVPGAGTGATYSAWAVMANGITATGSVAVSITHVAGLSLYAYGIYLKGATGNSAASSINLLSTTSIVDATAYFDNCIFQRTTANANAKINIGNVTSSAGSSSVKITLENPTFANSGTNTGSLIQFGNGDTLIINPSYSLTGASDPAILHGASASKNTGRVVIRDGSFIGFDSTGTPGLFDAATIGGLQILLENMELPAQAHTIVSGTWPAKAVGSITVRNCANSHTISVFEFYSAQGTLSAVASSVMTVTGALLFDTDAMVWKIITTSNATKWQPFEVPKLTVWNTNLASMTPRVEFITDAPTVAKDDEIFMRLSVPSSATRPSYTAKSDRAVRAFDTAGVAQAAGLQTWSGSAYSAFANGGSGKGQLNVDPTTPAITCTDVGLLAARIYIAVPGTFYIEPQIRL